MRARRLIGILAAAGIAAASVSASAQTVASIDRAAPSVEGASTLEGSPSAGIIIGFIVLVLVATVAISGNDEPESP